jgi:hypothetical protein
LDELIVPINTGRHGGMLIDPLNQLFLGIEAAPIDELPRHDRIEYESGRCMWIETSKQILNMIAPVFFSKPHLKRRRAAMPE